MWNKTIRCPTGISSRLLLNISVWHRNLTARYLTSQHAQWRSLTHTEALVHPVEQLLGVFGPGFGVEEGRLDTALAALQNIVQLQHLHGGRGAWTHTALFFAVTVEQASTFETVFTSVLFPSRISPRNNKQPTRYPLLTSTDSCRAETKSSRANLIIRSREILWQRPCCENKVSVATYEIRGVAFENHS